MADASRDGNHITSALGVSSSNSLLTLPFQVDPITGRLKVDNAGSGMGTVTEIDTGAGLTGGPITTTGTISLDSKLSPLDTLGSALQSIRVNAGATALEYYTPTGTIGGSIATGQVAFGSGVNTIAGDNQIFWDDTNHWLGIGTAVPTNSLTIASTGNGIALYNTTDQVTNFEVGIINWTSNLFRITSQQGGTGTLRAIEIQNHATVVFKASASSSGAVQISESSSNSTAVMLQLDNTTGSFSASSGSQIGLNIKLGLSQSGTAGYTALLINPAESTIGTGNKYLTDWQVGSSSLVSMTNKGLLDFHSTTNSSTGGLVFNNQTDEVTNFEQATIGWQSNIFTISSTKGGAGTLRSLSVTNTNNTLLFSESTGITVTRSANTSLSNIITLTASGLTSSASHQNAVLINPTINQSSTASYAALRIAPVETALGSGGGLLIQAGTSITASMFTVGNTGVTTASSFIPSSSTLPTNGLYLPATNTLGWAINSAAEIQLTSTAFSPAVDAGNSLGVVGGPAWGGLALSSGAVVDWNNSTMTLTQSGVVLTVGGGDLKINSPGTTSTSVVTLSATQTISNKRITKRVSALSAGSATPAINTDITDVVHITAQSANITSFTTNLTGTPVDGDTLRISVTDNGTARTLAFGASFEASTVPLPTSTVISARLDIGFLWNTETSKWRCVAVA